MRLLSVLFREIPDSHLVVPLVEFREVVVELHPPTAFLILARERSRLIGMHQNGGVVVDVFGHSDLRADVHVSPPFLV